MITSISVYIIPLVTSLIAGEVAFSPRLKKSEEGYFIFEYNGKHHSRKNVKLWRL